MPHPTTNEAGLEITVCHLPPGTSKWNKIEHRTTTRTGLTVSAELDTSAYPKGIKISDRQMKELEQRALRRHQFHGEWNYDLIPAHGP